MDEPAKSFKSRTWQPGLFDEDTIRSLEAGGLFAPADEASE